MKNLKQKLVIFFPARDLKETILRFPLSALSALGLFIMVVGQNHEWFPREAEDVVLRLSAIFVCGYFWFGATRLYWESRGQAGFALPFLVSVLVFGFLAFLLFQSGQFMLHLGFLLPAMLLLISVAPFIGRISDDVSFWCYNNILWTGVAVAMLAALIMWGGASAALASIDYLFNVTIKSEIYQDIGALACIILGPLNALSSVPRRFTFTASECRPVPGLIFLQNWILSPLVAVYMLILYAYFLKIALMQEMPRGQVAAMTMGFAGVGIVTYLTGWPFHENANALKRLLHRYFFPALIIPVCVMAFAAGERIDQYGVTEQRYAVALAALWLGVMAVAYTFRSLPLKYLPVSLAAVLFLASFGPWGAVNISGISQQARLENLLTKNNILAAEKTPAADKIPLEDRVNISSIVEYLVYTERYDRLEELGVETGEGLRKRGPYEIVQDMGFEYVSPWEVDFQNNYFSYLDYNSGPSGFIDVKNYDYVLPNAGLYSDGFKIISEDPPVKYIQEGNMVRLECGPRVIEFDVGAFLQENMNSDNRIDKTNLVIDAENDALKIRAFLKSANGEMRSGALHLSTIAMDIVVRLK